MIQNSEEKVIVITGATGKIGEAIVKKLLQRKVKLLLNYLNNERRALELQKEVFESGNQAIIFKGDVAQQKEVSAMYDLCIKKYGKVDVLINNAAICSDNCICLLRKKQWEEVIKTDLTGVYLCSRYFLKNMIKNRKGNIINIASVRGILGEKGQANYVAAKGGVISLTKALAKEVEEIGIDINAICPGHIGQGIDRYSKKEENGLHCINDEIHVNNVTNMIDFLCFDNLKGVTGKVFRLDSEFN